MASLTISNYLAMLQEDPGNQAAIDGIREIIKSGDSALMGEQPVRLIELARQSFESSGEIRTIASLIELELDLVREDPKLKAALYKELGRIKYDELLEVDPARDAYRKAAEILPDDREIAQALKSIEQAETSWSKFAERYVEEADSASDISLKTSLLVRAASLIWQFKRKGRSKEADKLFKRVFEIDPVHKRATQLYEQSLRERGKWDEIVNLLTEIGEKTPVKEERISLFLRTARILARRLNQKEEAVGLYRRVLSMAPTNPEALSYLADYYTEAEKWSDLTGLYEEALKIRQPVDVEQGILLQIGMLHWRKRGKLDEAEPYFARLRKLDCSQPVMLDFYRDSLKKADDAGRLLSVLSDAQRMVADPKKKLELAVEVARTAQANPAMIERSIDGWKLVQRLDPNHAEAASILKELYRKSEKWNALVEVLKGEIETIGESDTERRVGLLRELVEVYRDQLKMDAMVINTYNALLKIAPHDNEALTALAEKYQAMGRWNDLIQILIRQAESSEDKKFKIERYLSVASLWVERFANYNQATGPLEKVLELEPENREALSRLKDIYGKKRAWKSLFDVLGKETSLLEDPAARLTNTVEMASLAGERLHDHAQAIELWRHVIKQNPAAPGALDALERLAERERNWPVLAEALEKRAELLDTDDARSKVLQKLGILYAEQLESKDAATAVWRRVLQLDPKNARARRTLRESYLENQDWDALESMYTEADDWEALVDVLGDAADKNSDPKVKVDLSFRAARVFEDKIGEPQRAFRNYERILSVEPNNLKAARALIPIYEREEKWGRLVGALEVVLKALSPKKHKERLEYLGRIRKIALENLRDGELAFRYASEAFAEAPSEPSVIEGLEKATESAGDYNRLIEIFLARASDAEQTEAMALRRRVAMLAVDRISRIDLAVTQWQAILKSQPEDEEAIAVLDRVYRAGQRNDDLRSLLIHRLEHTQEATARKSILRELAVMEEEIIKDPNSAAARYREIGDLDPTDREAIVALDRLALQAERWGELADILRKRRELEEDDSACLELSSRLGLVLADKLADPPGALEVFSAVLETNPSHGQAISVMERLSDSNPELGPRIDALLEKSYERTERFDKLAKLLAKRLERASDEGETRSLRLQLAEISGTKLGDAMGAFGALEAAFLDQPDDRELWDRLAEAAERAGQNQALINAYITAIEAGEMSKPDAAELSARVAQLYDEVLGQPDEAERFHRAVLAHDPLDDTSFVALKELYTSSERWDELQGLYRKRIEETVDVKAKLELLLQLCFLFEEILNKPELAIDAYQSVLELEPDHGPAVRALDALFQRTGRWRDLVELLNRELDRAEGPNAIELRFRLGELHENKLGEPNVAVDQYQAVLAQQPNYMRAQEALERLLSVESQRQRIAAILEPLYETQGAYSDLVRILEIQLEGLTNAEERSFLLQRIAELQEIRLRDASAAFGAYARAVEVDPSDPRARQELARVAEAREDFKRKRVGVLDKAIDVASGSVALQSELLLELATLLDDSLGDKDAAERVYLRLVEVDHTNPEVVLTASRALERIHMAKGDHAGLAVDLRRQVTFEGDQEVRRQLLVRLGTLFEETLSDLPGAIKAHRERLEIDANDADAMRSLARLYQRTEQWPELIGILQALQSVEEQESERLAIARRVGAIYEESLGDRDNAIAAYNEVLRDFGPDREALDALARMYEGAERWVELLEVVQTKREQTNDPQERAQLTFRAAELMRTRTGNLERAIESYAEVLEVAPQHPGALADLEAIMADQQSAFRIEAARVALPRYEATQTYDKVVSVLEVLATTDDPGDKLQALRRAAEVSEIGLNDSTRAFTLMGRAIRAGIGDVELGGMLKRYEQYAETSGQMKEFVATLREIAPEIPDGELKPEVYRKIAEIARAHFNDASLARGYYAKVVEELPEDLPALDALDQLNVDLGDHAALIEVLRRKTDLTLQPEARRQLLLRQADVYENGLNDLSAAIQALEDVNEDQHNQQACQALERLYTVKERWSDLVGLYERQLERNVGDSIDLRYKLGNLLLRRLNDPYQALDRLRQVIQVNAEHEPTIALLESLMAEGGELKGPAAEILEPGYLARMEWPKLTSVLQARIEMEGNANERKRLLVRLGQIYEDQLEDFDNALEVCGRLFREDRRDQGVWETLLRLAKVNERWSRLADIFAEALAEIGVDDDTTAKLAMQTGRLYDDHAKALDKAIPFFIRTLEFDRTDAEAFRALESAYQRTNGVDELLELYRVQAEVAVNDDERVELLHRRARIFLETKRDFENAVKTYREILEVRPADKPAMDALDKLFTQLERWRDLADLLRHRVEQTFGTSDAIEFKYRLGELLAVKLGDKVGAIDAYEEISQLQPGHEATVGALEVMVQDLDHRMRITKILDPIYRHLDQWKKLIAILEAQVELLPDPLEGVPLLKEIAHLHESRGNDTPLAFYAYARAFERDPNDDDIRRNVDRLAAAMGAWDDLIAAYEKALQAATDSSLVASMLTTVARIHDERRGDPRAAIQTYERLLKHEPEDPSPFDSLEALHTMVGDWAGLVDILERRVQRSLDPQERGELLRRVGSVLEELLGDRLGAIDAYRRAAAEDETDAISLESLDRLYSAAGDGVALAEILKRRIDLTAVAEERVSMGLRLGELAEQYLRQPQEAITAFRRVLDDRPGDRVAAEALTRLFEQQQMWPELLENLKLRADIAEDSAEKVELIYRAAQVLEREMGDISEAIVNYREVLGLSSNHEASVSALIHINRSEQYRVQTAEILEPLLGQQGRWDELAQLLERNVDAMTDPHQRRDELRRIADVHEQGRHNPQQAFDALCRALAEDASDNAIYRELERLAEQLKVWDRLADVFGVQASSAGDPRDATALYRRLGRIAEEKLSDDARAIEALTRASDQEDDPAETLADLDRLYSKTEQWRELSEVLERRIGLTDNPIERTELQLRLGGLLWQQFTDGPRALAAYRGVLESDPNEARALEGMEILAADDSLAPDVVDVLDSAYRQSGAMAKVVGLYDIKVRLASSSRARIDLLQEAAVIWEKDLGEPRKALSALRTAFELDPHEESVLDELERLAGLGNAWDDVRGMVEGLTSSKKLESELRRDLNLKAGTWYTERLGDRTAAESCYRAAIEADPHSLEAYRGLVEVLRANGREADLVKALRAWAEIESDTFERKERLREAARLAESALGDTAIAAECQQSILDVDPCDVEALDQLARFYSAQERWKDEVGLLKRRIDVETDPSIRTELSYRIADLYRGPLDKRELAIETYRQILGDDPGQKRAADTLETLYQSAERWQELNDLLEQRLDRAETSGERVAARVRLARLAEQRFGKTQEAIEQLREILGEEPGNPEALDELERLYTSGKRWDELAELLNQRIDDASAAGNGARESAALIRLGQVYQNSLKDSARAIETYQRVVDRDANNREAQAILVGLYQEQQDWQSMAASMERLLQLSAPAEAIEIAFKLAELASNKLDNPQLAESALQRALVLDANSIEARDRLKAHYQKYQEHRKLIDVLVMQEQATTNSSNKVALLREVADLYYHQLQDPQSAIGYFERAVALVPDDRAALLPLCDLYIAANRQSDAIPVLERIVASYGGRRSKEVAVYQHRLGRALESMGDLDKALKYYDAAFKVDLTSVPVLRDLGMLCLKVSDLDRAQKTFRALLLQKLTPDAGIEKADIYYYLGEISAKQGDKVKAKSMLDRAVSEAGGKHPAAQKLLASLSS
jgi:golgin subfamily B member 1